MFYYMAQYMEYYKRKGDKWNLSVFPGFSFNKTPYHMPCLFIVMDERKMDYSPYISVISFLN